MFWNWELHLFMGFGLLVKTLSPTHSPLVAKRCKRAMGLKLWQLWSLDACLFCHKLCHFDTAFLPNNQMAYFHCSLTPKTHEHIQQKNINKYINIHQYTTSLTPLCLPHFDFMFPKTPQISSSFLQAPCAVPAEVSPRLPQAATRHEARQCGGVRRDLGGKRHVYICLL